MTGRRPRYHITAPTNWLNDPNGPIFWGGRYHLFFQHNPEAPRWGRPVWGHVSSADLIRWTSHPPALVPGDDGPDRDGCWSGCTRVLHGVPTIYYTGIVGHSDADRVEAVCRATSAGTLTVWEKDPRNPIIPGAPAEADTGHHRDPFLLQESDRWMLLLGSSADGPGGRGGGVLHYDSSDLEHWTYRGLLFHQPAGTTSPDTGPLWECPQLVALGGRHVLIVSVQDPTHPRPLRYAVAFIGELAGERFTHRSLCKLDHGDAYYAPATLVEDSGRVLTWGWLQETAEIEPGPSAFAGALSLPRTLALDDRGLAVTPADELDGLRGAALWHGSVTAGTDGRDIGPAEHHFELTCRLGVAGGRGDLQLRTDGSSRLTITLDASDGSVSVRKHDPGAAAGVDLITFQRTLQNHAALALRLFVDADVIELFIDERYALSTRLPRRDRPIGIRIIAQTEATATIEGTLYRLE